MREMGVTKKAKVGKEDPQGQVAYIALLWIIWGKIMLINLDIQIPNTSFDLLQVVAKKDQSFYARSQEQLRKKYIYIYS